MNFKTTYILFGVLLAAFGVFALVLFLNPTAAQNDVFVLPTAHQAEGEIVDLSTIASVQIERTRPTKETIAFARAEDGKGWRMTQPAAWKADTFAVEQLIRQVFDARKEKSDANSDLKRWDLDPPLATITITDKDNKSWTLNVGKERPGTDSAVVFVTSSDEPKEAMAISKSQADELFKHANDFRSKTLLSDSLADIRAVRLQPAKAAVVALHKKDETHWRFDEPKGYGAADYYGNTSTGTAPSATTGVRDLLTAVNDLRVDSATDFVADGVKDWNKYGIGPDSFRITVERGDGAAAASGTLILGKKTDAKEARYYARLDGYDTVVSVAAKNVDSITKATANPVALRSHDLIDVGQAGIDAVDVKNSHGTLRLRKLDNAWKIFDDAGKAAKTENVAVADLLRTLTAPHTIESFPPASDEAKLGLGDKAADAISIWVHGVEPAKDKDALPKLKGDAAVQLHMVRKDGQAYALAEAGQDKTLAKVAPTLYDKVEQDRLAYLDRTLPTFPADAEPTELALTRSGKTFQLTRDDKTGAWSLKQPGQKPVSADKLDVDAIVRDLRGLRARSLVVENATKADLARYGLGSGVDATLVMRKPDKKTEKHVYQFGSEKPSGVFAREDEHGPVFVTSPMVLRTLRAELRDRTLFRFSADKVKDIQLQGWKPVHKHSEMLDLQREGAQTWKAAKSPVKDFQVDSAKVDAFLRDLTDAEQPPIERFVDGPARPDYQLGPEQRTLSVTLRVEGEKTPVELTIGRLDPATRSYFAQSSTLPGAIFLISRDRLGMIAASADYFGTQAKPKVSQP